MSDNVVLYCENLPTEGMETLIAELCPPELDLRFLYPVKNGKKGDFEDADYILASIHKIGKDEMDRAKNLKLIHVPATGYNHVDLEYAKQKGIPVCNSNGENATTTAEFTIALMLARSSDWKSILLIIHSARRHVSMFGGSFFRKALWKICASMKR